MAAQDNPHMKSFVGTVRQLTADEKVKLACEARRRYSNDIATYEYMVKVAQEEAAQAKAALEEALKAAREEALKVAREEARAEVREEARRQQDELTRQMQEKDRIIEELRRELKNRT